MEEQKAEIITQASIYKKSHDDSSAKNEEISRQNIIFEQNSIKFTHSINYALRIQQALFPSEAQIKQLLPESFLIFKPKDVVSGDFYWLKLIENKIFLAVGDCTGHGVPGAFMSLLGTSFLQEIVSQKQQLRPDQILNTMREHLKQALKQTGKRNETSDGIDLSLCVIDMNNNKLQFAGANNPIYIARSLESKLPLPDIKNLSNDSHHLLIIEADMMPIGIYRKEKPFKYSEVQLDENDSIFMLSDGYQDQLGGNQGLKYMTYTLKRALLETASFSINEQYSQLLDNLDNWMSFKDDSGNLYEQVDDIVLFGFSPKYNSTLNFEARDINWQGKTILVAEDQELFFIILKGLIKRTRASVLWAKNGQEAIDICDENRNINLVLMDIDMPVMNGYEATKRIKEKHQDLTVIVQTAMSKEEKQKSFAAGADDLISKPIQNNELINTVSKYLN